MKVKVNLDGAKITAVKTVLELRKYWKEHDVLAAKKIFQDEILILERSPYIADNKRFRFKEIQSGSRVECYDIGYNINYDTKELAIFKKMEEGYKVYVNGIEYK